MNASTENAIEVCGSVSAKDLRRFMKPQNLRFGERFYLRGDAAPNRESWSSAFVFTIVAQEERRDSSPGQTRTLTMPGYVTNGYETFDQGSTGRVYRPSKGFWSLLAVEDRLRSALEFLPSDAGISFSVRLDHGTNGNARAAVGATLGGWEGLHSDALMMHATVTKGKTTRTLDFLLDTELNPHNTARFGSPGSWFG